MNGNVSTGGDAGSITDAEAGALDNRLSVNINDPMFESLGADKWEDGETYDVSLKVKQVSPGEFEVVGASKGGASDETETPAEDTTDGGEPGSQGGTPGSNGRVAEGYENPAVAGMV